MSIDVKTNSVNMKGNILAIASIDLNQCLVVRNVHLMDDEKDMLLPMPSYRTENGELGDIYFPIMAEFRTQMTKTLTSAYKEALTIQQGKMTRMIESPAPQMAPIDLPM